MELVFTHSLANSRQVTSRPELPAMTAPPPSNWRDWGTGAASLSADAPHRDTTRDSRQPGLLSAGLRVRTSSPRWPLIFAALRRAHAAHDAAPQLSAAHPRAQRPSSHTPASKPQSSSTPTGTLRLRCITSRHSPHADKEPKSLGSRGLLRPPPRCILRACWGNPWSMLKKVCEHRSAWWPSTYRSRAMASVQRMASCTRFAPPLVAASLWSITQHAEAHHQPV
jgi:hypothetical protein